MQEQSFDEFVFALIASQKSASSEAQQKVDVLRSQILEDERELSDSKTPPGPARRQQLEENIKQNLKLQDAAFLLGRAADYGALLKRWTKEFPDMSASKRRFAESQIGPISTLEFDQAFSELVQLNPEGVILNKHQQDFQALLQKSAPNNAQKAKMKELDEKITRQMKARDKANATNAQYRRLVIHLRNLSPTVMDSGGIRSVMERQALENVKKSATASVAPAAPPAPAAPSPSPAASIPVEPLPDFLERDQCFACTKVVEKPIPCLCKQTRYCSRKCQGAAPHFCEQAKEPNIEIETYVIEEEESAMWESQYPKVFSAIPWECFPTCLQGVSDTIQQTLLSYLACYIEYRGHVYLYRDPEQLQVSQSAWSRISRDFQPAPSFGEFHLPDGWVCNQRQETCARFQVSISNVQEVVDRLLVLHRHGIVHGDLKPEHVRCTENGEILFIDFDACSLSEGGRLTPEFASAEVIFEDGALKTPADDLEALLWICWETATQRQVRMESAQKRDRFSRRLELMDKVLRSGRRRLQSAFLHVWMLPRTQELPDDAYQLPSDLDIFAVSKKVSATLAGKVSSLYPTSFPVSNDLGTHKNFFDEQNLQQNWRKFFDCEPKPGIDVKAWARLRKSPTSTEYDLLLLNSHFERDEDVRHNVAPKLQVEDYTHDERKEYLDGVPGYFVAFETSVGPKSLPEVSVQMSTLLPPMPTCRVIQIWFTFSCIVLIHKGQQAEAIERNTLVRCINDKNFFGAVLAGSGRLAIYLQSNSRLEFTKAAAQTIQFHVNRITANHSQALETAHQRALASLETAHQRELENMRTSHQRELESMRTSHERELENTRRELENMRTSHERELENVRSLLESTHQRELANLRNSLETAHQRELENLRNFPR